MDLNHARELFEIRHLGRTLRVWRHNRGRHRRYIGAINGSVCAISPAKGDLLRRMILMSRHYPTEKKRRRPQVARSGNSR